MSSLPIRAFPHRIEIAESPFEKSEAKGVSPFVAEKKHNERSSQTFVKSRSLSIHPFQLPPSIPSRATRSHRSRSILKTATRGGRTQISQIQNFRSSTLNARRSSPPNPGPVIFACGISLGMPFAPLASSSSFLVGLTPFSGSLLEGLGCCGAPPGLRCCEEDADKGADEGGGPEEGVPWTISDMLGIL